MNLTNPPVLCIWCQRSDDFTVEHILPDALGCPPELVLETGVCRKCNRINGKLDRSLLKPFELITVIKGIKRKGGRHATVNQHSTFTSVCDKNGHTLFLNRERHFVETPLGKRLGPTSADDVILDYEHEVLRDGTVQVKFKQKLIFDRLAVRGLFKVALELVAFYEGLPAAHGAYLDAVRRYVRYDEGELYALFTEGGQFNFYLPNRFVNEAGDSAVPMTILECGFVCDISPDFRIGRNLIAIGRLQGINLIKLPM